MVRVIEQTNQVARKEHHCYECETPIKVGEEYIRQRVDDYGDHYVYKAHEKCYSAAWAYIYTFPDFYHGDYRESLAEMYSQESDAQKGGVFEFLSKDVNYSEVLIRLNRGRGA